jgi:hypothetical protein
MFAIERRYVYSEAWTDLTNFIFSKNQVINDISTYQLQIKSMMYDDIFLNPK